MKRLFRAGLVKTAAMINMFPTRMTDGNKLQSLIQKLYPLYIGKELIRLGPDSDGGYLVPDDLVATGLPRQRPQQGDHNWRRDWSIGR